MSVRSASGPPDGLKVAAYLRVSTEKQVNEGYSLADQRRMITDHCQRQGWEIVDFYTDAGVSGAKAERDERERMFADLEAGRANAVCCIKLNRFERGEALDQHQAFARISAANAWFLTVEDRVAVGPDADPAELFLRSILGAVSTYERAEIRAKTHRGVISAARAGGWPGGYPPFGYDTERPNGRGPVKVLIDEKDAETVRLIADMVVNKRVRFSDVVKHLNATGRETPSQAALRKNPDYRDLVVDHWRPALRGWVERNEIWGGTWTFRPGGVDEPIVLDVPPILDKETHRRLVAAAREQRSDYSGRRKYLLSGRVVAPCGQIMQPQRYKDSRSTSLRCSPPKSGRNEDGSWNWASKCDCKRIPLEPFEASVWDEVTSMLKDPEWLLPLVKIGREETTQHRKVEGDDLAAIGRKIGKTKNALRKLVKDSALNDMLDEADVADVIDELNQDLARLNEYREKLIRWQQQTESVETRKGELWELANRWSSMLSAPDRYTAREIIEQLGLRVVIGRWDECETCLGKMIIGRKRVEELNLGGIAEKRGSGHGYFCPTCHRTGSIPVVRYQIELPDAPSLVGEPGPDMPGVVELPSQNESA